MSHKQNTAYKKRETQRERERGTEVSSIYLLCHEPLANNLSLICAGKLVKAWKFSDLPWFLRVILSVIALSVWRAKRIKWKQPGNWNNKVWTEVAFVSNLRDRLGWPNLTCICICICPTTNTFSNGLRWVCESEDALGPNIPMAYESDD